MPELRNKYFEVRPGVDSLRYLVSYSFLTLLAKRVRKRESRLFTEGASNVDRHILSEGFFEKGILDLLKDLVLRTGHDELMIDVGANIGNHTVALAPLFRQVESVEPHPVLFRILSANVLANRLAHVTCHNFGLANEDTSATLVSPTENHALGRVTERSQLAPETFGFSDDAPRTEFTIDLKSALAFFSRFEGKLDSAFVKIDVEGMEEEIITAIKPLLHEHKPVVGFEWFTKDQPALANLASEISGYELWGIRAHDAGSSLAWRAVKLMFAGRSFGLERLDLNNLDEVYPLALLVPTGKLG